MTALDEVIVKDGVDQETVDAVREVGGAYKYGWETEIEMEYAPKGLNEDIVRLISDKNEEPEWMTGGFRPLEEIKRAEMGDGKLSRD